MNPNLKITVTDADGNDLPASAYSQVVDQHGVVIVSSLPNSTLPAGGKLTISVGTR